MNELNAKNHLSDITVSQSTDPIRVLSVEDQADLTEPIAQFLTRANDQRTVEMTTNVSEGIDRLTDMTPTVSSRTTRCQPTGIKCLVSGREEYFDLPVILVTGKGNEEVASETISPGVTDSLQSDG